MLKSLKSDIYGAVEATLEGFLTVSAEPDSLILLGISSGYFSKGFAKEVAERDSRRHLLPEWSGGIMSVGLHSRSVNATRFDFDCRSLSNLCKLL